MQKCNREQHWSFLQWLPPEKGGAFSMLSTQEKFSTKQALRLQKISSSSSSLSLSLSSSLSLLLLLSHENVGIIQKVSFSLTYPKIFSVCWLQKKKQKKKTLLLIISGNKAISRGENPLTPFVCRGSHSTRPHCALGPRLWPSFSPSCPPSHPPNQPTNQTSLPLITSGWEELKNQHLYDFQPFLAWPVGRLNTQGSLPAIWRYYRASLIQDCSACSCLRHRGFQWIANNAVD